MAKVEISVDTSEQTVAVTVDGKSIGEVTDVWVSAGSFFGMEISLKREDLGDLTQVTRLVAAEDAYLEDKGYCNVSPSEFDSFVSVSDPDTIAALSRALLGKKA